MSTPEDIPPHEPNLEKREALNLYAAFGVSLALTLVPHGIVALVAFLFMLGVLIAAYMKRGKTNSESLLENHCTFIIRTIWIGSFLSAILMSISAFIMMADINYAALEPCIMNMASKGEAYIMNAGITEMSEVAAPCLDAFIADNFQTIAQAALITIIPTLLYFIFRYVKGLSRAIKGYRVANPKNWF